MTSPSAFRKSPRLSGNPKTMTAINRLTTSARNLTTTAVGAALGLAFTAALAFAPLQAIAQVPAASAGAASAQAPGRGPGLWVISDADSTIYLFGTVHMLRPNTAWGSASVDAAFNSADTIWFEISNPDDTAAIMPLIQQYGISPATPLSSLLTPAEFAELDVAAQTMGATAAQLDPLRPWFAALSLAMAPILAAGYDPESGVEMKLKARAEAAGKPIRGLETIDQQVRILATLPEDIQLQFLRATLKDMKEGAGPLDALVEAWASGDVEGLDRLAVAEMKDETPHIHDVLLVKRNVDWADQIQGLLAGSGTAFIAVGAAHLAGEDSVQAILERRGVISVRQ